MAALVDVPPAPAAHLPEASVAEKVRQSAPSAPPAKAAAAAAESEETASGPSQETQEKYHDEPFETRPF